MGGEHLMGECSQAEDTRQRLIEAATREFAEHGVHAASLLEVTRQAGQRNRGAVHYHFGSREGMLVAVIEQQVDFLAERERELLAIARERPDDDLESVVLAFVRPAVELADIGWQGRCYLQILAELVEDDPDKLHPDVVAALEPTGGWDALELLRQRTPAMPEHVREERLSLVVGFILRTVGDQARNRGRSIARPQLETQEFIANLVAMVIGMLTAPVPR
jgi:AcrR family transcriptional regulator